MNRVKRSSLLLSDRCLENSFELKSRPDRNVLPFSSKRGKRKLSFGLGIHSCKMLGFESNINLEPDLG